MKGEDLITKGTLSLKVEKLTRIFFHVFYGEK
jgi:hypothetical protein